MKTAGKLFLGLTMALAFGLMAVRADEKASDSEDSKKGASGEVTLKGTITCAKCDLKLEKKCATVIKVKKDGKDVVYFFDKDSNKKYHGDTCMEAKQGSVTGTTAEKDDKHWIKVSKVEYK
jgi:hypothetical protein